MQYLYKSYTLSFWVAFLMIHTLHTQEKFEPKDGECLVFIGQDLEAVGGLNKYNDGYCDYFEMPAGITFYSNLSPGDVSYNHTNKGNDGLKTPANWGAGDSCGQYYVDHKKFDRTAFAIGLSLVNHEKQIAKGKHDTLIKELAEWIQSTKRPVFLRIGYEFDGWDWNNYKRKNYLKAWQRIHNIFSELDISNVAFVWQSKGVGSDQNILEKWYPGDDIVDWCGYSYFGNPDTEMITFARRHKKPVFIAEATPVDENDGLYFDARLTNPKTAQKLWKNWYLPFFKTINDHKDVIKAFSYINVNWPSQIMWKNNATFQKVDSRLQESTYVSDLWKKELNHPRYIKASNSTFKTFKK